MNYTKKQVLECNLASIFSLSKIYLQVNTIGEYCKVCYLSICVTGGPSVSYPGNILIFVTAIILKTYNKFCIEVKSKKTR